MAKSSTMQAARRAAREAAFAAQEEAARQARANAADLTVYFAARQRAEAVDDWLAQRVAVLRGQASTRRVEQLRQCGVALAALRERGESVRDIARMVGLGEKAVRDLLRSAAESATAGQGGEWPVRVVADGGAGGHAPPSASVTMVDRQNG